MCEKLGALVRASGDSHHWQTFLTDSGTEAVEASIKLVAPPPGRPNPDRLPAQLPRPHAGLAVADGSKSKVPAAGFGPLLPGVFHATYGDMTTSRSCSRRTAPDNVTSIVVEPVLGGGGHVAPAPEFLRGLREDRGSSRDPARVRRGPDRASDGRGRSSPPARQRRPRHRARRQGDRVGDAAGRDDREEADHDLAGGEPRLHDRGQPGRDRRRARDDRPAGEGAGRELGRVGGVLRRR